MDMTLSVAVGVAVATSLGWLVSIATMVIKGKDWVESTALRVIESAEGRDAVLRIVADKNDRIESQLEAMTKSLDGMAARLEARIDAMSSKLETRLDRLDKDAHGLDKRMSLLESQR